MNCWQNITTELRIVNMLFHEMLFEQCDDVKIFSMSPSNLFISVAACSLVTVTIKTMSFSESSRNISLNHVSILTAECIDDNGIYRHSTIALSNKVANHDGRLTVASDGNFGVTSRNVHLVGSVLHAECLNRRGEWCTTQLDLDWHIANDNGQLIITRYRECNGDL